MGHHASAAVVYGVDLGDREYDELNVDVPEEYMGDGLGEAIDNLISEWRTELAGPKPEKYPWEGGDQAAWDRWRNSNGPVGYSSYGYEYSGVVITTAHIRSEDYGATPFELGDTHDEKLEEFLQFLESKGFKFHEGKRKAQWLVTASYG